MSYNPSVDQPWTARCQIKKRFLISACWSLDLRDFYRKKATIRLDLFLHNAREISIDVQPATSGTKARAIIYSLGNSLVCWYSLRCGPTTATRHSGGARFHDKDGWPILISMDLHRFVVAQMECMPQEFPFHWWLPDGSIFILLSFPCTSSAAKCGPFSEKPFEIPSFQRTSVSQIFGICVLYVCINVHKSGTPPRPRSSPCLSDKSYVNNISSRD